MSTPVSPIPQAARPYQGRPAGLVSRFLAAAVDLLVVLFVLLSIYAAWSAVLFLLRPAAFEFPSPSNVIGFGLGFFVLTLYFAAAWATTGRTYGDQVMGLRILDNAGNLLRPPRALFRAVLCAAFPIGLLWVAVSQQHKSLQDILSRTSVIHDWHSADTLRTPQPRAAPRKPFGSPSRTFAARPKSAVHDHE
jgi:uncharacterized RDD family membrane protein YckC